MRGHRKQQPEVTHEDLQQAIRRFKQRGGLVKKLPDEVAPRSDVVRTTTDRLLSSQEL